MSDEIRVSARLRLWQFDAQLGRNVEQAHKRAGAELRDKVKESLNVPGYVRRKKGDVMTKGFVIRKAERVGLRDSSGRFLKGQGGGAASARTAQGLVAREGEINYDVARSKPGEPPRRQRGDLYKSLTTETKASPRGVSTRVGPDVTVAKKARALELGYEPGGLEARPYLAPAAREFRPQFDAIMARAIRRSTS